MLEFLAGLSFRRKLLLFTISMVIFMGGTMGLLIRFIIFPYLTHEMENRGLSIARRLSESSRTPILMRDGVSLTSLLFEEKALEENVAFILVTDDEGRLLAHTLLGPLPDGSSPSAPATGYGLSAGAISRAYGESVSDIVVPVYEGLYQIGTVRVGLDRQFIHALIRRLSLYHMGFIGFITMVAMLYGLYLSQIITRPVAMLKRLVGRISMGDLNTHINLGAREPCWEILQCELKDCPARDNEAHRCWFVDGTLGKVALTGSFPEKLKYCSRCQVRKRQSGDELVQLADAFNHMAERLRTSEMKLRSSEERYRLLFNCDPNPIFVVALATGAILDANDRAAEVYGYGKDAMVGLRLTALGFEDDLQVAGAIADLALDGEKQSTLIPKVRMRRQNGEILWVNIYFQRYVHVGTQGIIATTTDVTEIIEAETKLIQAGKMTTLGEMAAGVAHELNQPLNAIKIGSEYLQTMLEQGKSIPEEDLREVAGEISTDVDRAALIINHLREFGRKSDVVRQRISINGPIRGVFKILGQQLKVHGVSVVMDLDETLPPIMADENRLEQVFINLVNNARDAIEARREADRATQNGTLTIRSFLHEGRVTATVSDTGSGIPERIRGRIFEPFFTTKDVGKGTGLGLSISYGILRDYDGTIDLETEEGAGTTFMLSFPVAPEERRND